MKVSNNKVRTRSKKEYWHNSGLLKKEVISIVGTEFKFERRFSYKGKLQVEIPFINNKMNGVVREYSDYKVNRLSNEEFYINDRKNGKATYYWDNGNISIIADWKNDERTGMEYDFHENTTRLRINQLKSFEENGIDVLFAY